MMKSIITLAMSFILLFTSFSVNVSAKEIDNENVYESTIQLYNTNGNLIAEFESEEEFDNYLNRNRISYALKVKIIEITKKVAEALVIEVLVEGIKDGWRYLNEMQIKIPTLKDGQIATVISNDGNISNPYPPNSYQAKVWVSTNFVVKVRYA